MANERLKEILKDKKHIFFDVGFTLDKPASGDFLFINKFYELANNKLDKFTSDELRQAKMAAIQYGEKHHKMETIDEEIENLKHYYQIISDYLQLELSEEDIDEISRSRALDMENYVAYPNLPKILSELKKRYSLGIISDTYPSIKNQLKHLDIFEYFDSFTFSYELGVFKPNELMYIDALSKCLVSVDKTVFIDDSLMNLEAAQKLGITPILIAANPKADVETNICKIYSLDELLEALD